jgi:peptidoglycan-associated lipoprotein
MKELESLVLNMQGFTNEEQRCHGSCPAYIREKESMKRDSTIALAAIAILLISVGAGCKKKASVAALPQVPKAEVPEAPKPKLPTIVHFGLEPDTIERGQSATLGWQVIDASEIQIDQGVGPVESSGQRRVSPDESTSYTLYARGPGGEVSAMAGLNVRTPPPPPPTAVIPKPAFRERVERETQDAYFDFDRSNLRGDAREALATDSEALKSIFREFPTATVVVEGHCDERGSAEYNLALGDRRATEAKQFLTELGVPTDQLLKISYGKERLQCTESNEQCWQLNRRVHFVAGEEQGHKQISRMGVSSLLR